MKTYKVELWFEKQTHYVPAENETDAKAKGIKQFEDWRFCMKADDIKVSDTPVIKVKYCGSDHFYRPIFKDVAKEVYYGSTHILLSNHDFKVRGKESLTENDLVYFGNSFGCEPMGTTPAGTLEIVWNV
jgi:hypothetical protein